MTPVLVLLAVSLVLALYAEARRQRAERGRRSSSPTRKASPSTTPSKGSPNSCG